MSTSVILIVVIVFAVLVLRFAKKILFRFFGVLIIGGVILGYMYKESLGPFEDNVADIGLLEQKYCEEDGDAERFINYREKYFDEGSLEWVEYDPSDRDVNRSVFDLNWDRRFDYQEEEIVPILADMYYPQPERYYKRREIDVRKLMFRYFWIDYREAARRGRINVVPNGYDNEGNVLVDEHRQLNTP